VNISGSKNVKMLPKKLFDSFLGGLLRLLIALISVSLALPPGMMLSAAIYTETAFANSYATGFSLYQKGSMKDAEAALKQALQRRPNAADKIKIYKLLGICQYMLRNKAEAAASFKQALAMSPGLTISANEVLDESVIEFFNQQKGATNHAAKSASAAPSSANPRAAKTLNSTFLKVGSNVNSATVMIDGINAGPVNSLIDTDPGVVIIEVTSPGYITRKIRVNVTKGRENSIQVDLKKPTPKPKAVAASPATHGAKESNSSNVGKKPRHSKNANAKIFAPKPKDDLFGDDGGAPIPQPTGPDLTSEFEAEASGYAAAPAYNAPPPGYAAPPTYGPSQGYPPQGYQQQYPPQQAYTPPPAYYAPPPTYYTPPPPAMPPQPAYDSYAAAPAPAYVPPDPGADPYTGGGDPGGSGPRSPRAKKSRSTGKNNMLITLLPFGAGQFQNRSYILGILFGGAEAGALYMWYSKNQTADQTVEETQAYYESRKDEQMTTEDRTAFEAYIVQQKSFVADKRKEANMYLYGFGALYVAGVIEAIINDNPPTAKKKKRKKRKFGGFTYNLEEQSQGQPVYSLLEDKERPVLHNLAWQLGLTPPRLAPAPLPTEEIPAVAVQVKWTF
jgi:hypothetical protein